jgi:hypothetical protein
MSSSHSSAPVVSISPVARLARRLDLCGGSDEYVAVIHALVATRDPQAIRVLASLLDGTGPIAEEAITGLLAFGKAVVPAMRRCADSDDYDMIRHARRVLAALGDAESVEWMRSDDDDRVEAYLERQGITEQEWPEVRSLAANEADQAEGAA